MAAKRGELVNKNRTLLTDDKDLHGYIDPEEQGVALKEITKGSALNPVSLHFAVIGVTILLGYGMLNLITRIPALSSFTITATALLAGLIVAIICNNTSIRKYIDRESLSNVSGLCLEFLIVISLANTNLGVFIDYGWLILILTVVLLALTTFMILKICKRCYPEAPIENTVGTFGVATGVLATGFLLLRVADPNNDTDAAVNLSTGTLINSVTAQTFYLFIFPPILMSKPLGATVGTGIAFVVLLVIELLILKGRKTS